MTATLWAAASILAGCATTTAPSTPAPVASVASPSVAAAPVAAPTQAEKNLQTRAQERWDLLLTEKYEGAYGYITPAYRALHTAKDYSGRFGSGAKWVSAKVQSTQCASSERCTVQVLVETLVVARGFNGPIKTTVTETWLNEEGQWWYYQAP